MKFEIYAERNAKDTAVFYYDNQTNVLTNQQGEEFKFPEMPTFAEQPTKPFSKEDPLRKSRDVNMIKIQLGLSCNYSCDYCSQKFVERPPETSKKDIDAFMAKLDVLNITEERGLRVEFWGGEPFVYWKTLKPLAEAFAERYSHWKKRPQFSVVTNGSLLTREICSWLYYMGFGVGISHDGPGQAVRGPDPFEDPERKKVILEFYKIMAPQNRISFNAMMNRNNTSRRAIKEYFVELTGDPNVKIGEGGFIDAYDQDGANSSLNTLDEHFAYRRQAFNDLYTTGKNLHFDTVYTKLDAFISSLLAHRPAELVGQKCGMEEPGTVALDLKGNIVTCQNVSVMETSKNGEAHLGGNLDDYDNVALKGVTHWKSRTNKVNCADCPVLHLCKGSCMYLDGEFWDITCNNAYSDNIPLFAMVLNVVTNGYIPVTIKAEGLPLERQDIWGTVYKHEETTKKKIIPIKVISEKIGTLDDIEVYGKSRVEL